MPQRVKVLLRLIHMNNWLKNEANVPTVTVFSIIYANSFFMNCDIAGNLIYNQLSFGVQHVKL